MPAVVGLGVAAELAVKHFSQNAEVRRLRDRLQDGLISALGDNAVLLGHPEKRLPNTLAIGFKDCIGAEILAMCPDICASTGAACHATVRKRSAVLEAMDIPEEIAFGAIRLSLGRHTAENEIDQAIEQLAKAVRELQ